jgi:integrase
LREALSNSTSGPEFLKQYADPPEESRSAGRGLTSEVHKLLTGIPLNAPLWPLSAIGAYTGMRREEIAQLLVSDVTEDGALVVRKGKTQAAVRRIPIHPVLKPLIDQLIASTADGYLIPGLLTGGRDAQCGHYLGKRFTNLRRDSGLDSPLTVFHSFRKAMAQRCEDKDVPESATELIGG